MNWFFYSLLGAILTAAYQLLSRALLKGKGDSIAFTFVTTVFGTLILFIFLPWEKPLYSTSLSLILVFLGLGLIYALDDWLFIKARQAEEASKIAVAIQSSHFWALLGGLLIFGESLTVAKLLGVSLIVLANLAVLWQSGRPRPSRGFLLALLGVFVFAAYSFVDKSLLRSFSPSLYKITVLLIESTWLFMFLGEGRIKRSLSEIKLQGWPIIIVGPLLSVALYFVARAFQAGGEASRVLPVLSLSTVLVSLGGVAFLGEKSNRAKKVLASFAALLGVLLINSG